MKIVCPTLLAAMATVTVPLGATEIPFLFGGTTVSGFLAVAEAIYGFPADVDGDGDVDLLGVGSTDGKVHWWANVAGDGSTWSEHTIDASVSDPRSVGAADLDGDGDLDAFGTSRTGAGRVIWWSNDGGAGASWTTHDVELTSGFGGAYSVVAGDVDRDGDLDLVAAAQSHNDVAWFENRLDQGMPWVENTIEANFSGARSVVVADVDGDGDLDVVGAAPAEQDVSWFENRLDEASGWTEHLVNGTFGAPRTVRAGDMDGDGDPDVVAATAGALNRVSWFENPSWTEHQVGGLATPTGLELDDLDLDGDLDVLATRAATGPASGIDVYWFENQGGGLAFTSREVENGFDEVEWVGTADVDGDGDRDVVSASKLTGEFRWWTNLTLHRSALFAESASVTGAGMLADASSGFPVDLDRDGATDLLGAGGGTVSWWRNATGDGSTWVESPIDGAAADVRDVLAVDLDSDGDLDAVGADRTANRVLWWENGAGWTPHDVDADFGGAFAVAAGDLDGDGDLDLAGAAQTHDEISWFENQTGSFTTHRINLAGFQGARAVAIGDVDGDGDLDVVGAAATAQKVTWFENRLDEITADWLDRPVVSAFGAPRNVRLGDLDGDGDLDLAVATASKAGAATANDNMVAWLENQSGGSVWMQNDIAIAGVPTGLALADVDLDGDLDVLAALAGAAVGNTDVRWWENEVGVFAQHELVPDFDDSNWIGTADFDGDGDLDLAAASTALDEIRWWKNDGGQAAFTTTDVVPTDHPLEGSEVAVLEVVAAHRGRTGDGDAEVATYELLFEETAGVPLAGAELDALVDAVRLWDDQDDDGVLDPDIDDNFFTLGPPFSLVGGVLTATLVDGDPAVSFSVGGDRRHFVSLDLAAGAGTAVPGTLRVSHLTESSSTAEMLSTDLPLLLERAVDTPSTQMSINAAPTLVAVLADDIAEVGLAFQLDVSSSFSDPDGDPLTFVATGLPDPSLSITPTGVIQGTPEAGDLLGSPFTVEITAIDPYGEVSPTGTFQLVVRSPEPIFSDGFESGDSTAWSRTQP